MNAMQFDRQPQPFSAMQQCFVPASAAHDEADDHWAEFLGLGMPADGHVDAKGWQRAPVLLSF